MAKLKRSLARHKVLLILLSLLILLIIIGIVTNIFTTKFQILLAAIVGFFTSLLASIFFTKIRKRLSLESDITEETFPHLEDRIKQLYHLATHLSIDRKNRIIDFVRKYEPILRKKRRMHLLGVRKQQRLHRKKGTFNIDRPAWYNLCTTSSKSKYRLTLGFKNQGCSYWRDDPDKVGCYHCGYASSTIQNGAYQPTKHDLLAQFDYALDEAYESEIDFDVVEFLNDGSFFNYKKEFPDGFPEALFRKLGKLKNVKRILIESRPISGCDGKLLITKDKIRGLLQQLNRDQKLEIGIGLETNDEFIKEACIHKGYNNQSFERAVEEVTFFKNRCGIVVYTIVKPAFLTENEAIADVVNTIKYLSRISDKYKIPIIPKLEPAVIARGTLLDILHFDVPNNSEESYEPLSYWSIVEIIAQAHLVGLDKNIRIGARDDMDIIEKVPAIYNEDGTFNQHDFWVYEAVQRFNAHHDFIKLISDLQLVMERDNSFKNWEETIIKSKSAISTLLDREKDKVAVISTQDDQKRREDFLLQVFDVLDKIELESDSIDFAKWCFKNRKKGKKGLKEDVQEFINKKFKIPSLYVRAKVRSIFFERDHRHMLRVSFHLRDKTEGVLYEIWVGIPTID